MGRAPGGCITKDQATASSSVALLPRPLWFVVLLLRRRLRLLVASDNPTARCPHLTPVVASVRATTPASFQRAWPATSDVVQYGMASWGIRKKYDTWHGAHAANQYARWVGSERVGLGAFKRASWGRYVQLAGLVPW